MSFIIKYGVNGEFIITGVASNGQRLAKNYIDGWTIPAAVTDFYNVAERIALRGISES